MRRCSLKITALLVVVVVLTAWITPANSALALAEPDSISLNSITIFNGLLVDDDFLAFVPYEIIYGTAPTTADISDTFLFRILSADGTTELGTVTANPAYNDGYGQGAVSFYIESGMTWGSAYIFRVQENPAYYPSAQYWDFVADNTSYSEASDQAAALKSAVVDSATTLTIEFSTALLDKSEAGTTVLSSYGELYYLDVIPGLQIMCPALFSVQLENPDFTKRTWSKTLATTLQTRFSGTFVEDFMTGFAGLFSIDTIPAANWLSIILFLVLVMISVWKFKATILSAMMDGYALLLLLMLMGFFSMIWAGFIAFLLAVAGGGILLFKRA